MKSSPLVGAGQSPSQSMNLWMECPVDISETELHSIGGQGSKGQRPLASLGTAPRLIPVHSGLPLCETCLSSAAIPYVLITSAPLHTSKRKAGRWQWFCGMQKGCEGNGSSHLSREFLFPEYLLGIPLRCAVPDNHVPYPAPKQTYLPVLFVHPANLYRSPHSFPLPRDKNSS